VHCDINSHIGAYTDDVFKFIRSKVNSDVVAEDLTQEVLFELVKSCKKSDDVNNVKSWMFQVSRNVLYKYYNEKKLKTTEIDENIAMSEGDVFELGEAVNDLIKKLPEGYREILFKADIEGLKLQEVADDLGLSLSAVKMRVQRGRKMLLELFQNNCDIEYDAQGQFVSCELKCC